ncbi:unnamed protein product [Somion occarium]|uniref:Uncharacterized protein n=1 Tax=Somion occarium TaxID=3059160 RepID=A0ABP1CUX5_9APHY
MDGCPPEIWQHIFSFACVDGGYTGRSLSLGPEKICQLASILEEATYHIRIKHLYMSWTPVSRTPPPDFDITLLKDSDVVHALCSYNLTREEAKILRDRIADDATLESEHVKWVGDLKLATRHAAERLLPLVASDLNSLSATFSFGMHIPPSLWSTYFPELRELTIFGCSIDRFEFSESSIIPTTDVVFPALLFLHLAYCDKDIELFTTRAPHLTHLRLSEVMGLSTRSPVSNLSKSICSVASGMLQTEEKQMIFPWSLRRILLQPPEATTVMMRALTRRTISRYAALLRADKKDVVRLLDPLPRRSLSDAEVQVAGGRKGRILSLCAIRSSVSFVTYLATTSSCNCLADRSFGDASMKYINIGCVERDFPAHYCDFTLSSSLS